MSSVISDLTQPDSRGEFYKALHATSPQLLPSIILKLISGAIENIVLQSGLTLWIFKT